MNDQKEVTDGACCITPESDPLEWEVMWKKLSHDHGDVCDPCPCCREVWEYMGTSFRKVNDRNIYQHSMRHRHHPVSGKREYVWIDASPGWRPGPLTLGVQNSNSREPSSGVTE
jgi:hypothetical protein